MKGNGVRVPQWLVWRRLRRCEVEGCTVWLISQADNTRCRKHRTTTDTYMGEPVDWSDPTWQSVADQRLHEAEHDL